MSDLEKAFKYLIELVQKGVEFPDACWKASQKYGVPYVKLREKYDE